MDFNARIDDLQNRVEQLKTSVAAAAKENHEQLNQRIDHGPGRYRSRAQPRPSRRRPRPTTRPSRRGSRPGPTRRPASTRSKVKAQRRADQVDADFAASDADLAEADAYAAIDYADWAVENARVAILDAIDARITADEKAAALV